MHSPLRRRIRHTRRLAGYGGLVLLIAVALLVGIANQLLPMVERHPRQIADWLSARVGEPVSFTRARGEWTRRGPRFILDGLHVGEGASRLDIGRAQLQVAMYSGLLPGQPLTELKIRDLALTLVQSRDGRWKVIGLPGQGGAVDPLDRLDGFGELQIEKARLSILAPRLKLELALARVDARIRVDGRRLRVGVSAWADAAGAPLSAVLDLDRTGGDGLLWAGGSKLGLQRWHALLAAAGLRARAGTADLDVWATLDDQRITQVTVHTDLRDLRLQSLSHIAQAEGGSRTASMALDRAQVRARWRQTDNGWQLHAPVLSITRQGATAHLDQILIDGGERIRLRADKLDLAPVAALLTLSDRVPAPLREFLQRGNPQAVLRSVRIDGVRGGTLRGSMNVSRVVLRPGGTKPGLSGLAGNLMFDQRGGVFRITPSAVTVSWPAGLRQPLEVRPSGTLALWKSGPGWILGSDALRIEGAGFGTGLRLQTTWQGDGSAPVLELAAALDTSTVETARKFWILHKMRPSVVQWLDAALVSGEVADGRIAFGGDLDDWPFQNHAGRLDARATLRKSTLKFNQRWPAGENLSLDLVFNGPGFSLQGSGDLAGNRIESVSGGIAQFREPWLALDIQSAGSGENLRRLLMASPLQDAYGEHLRAVGISGKARTDVSLLLPMSANLGEKSIKGTLDLERATLADSRWNLRFSEVSGRTRFSDKGFATENLSVRLANQPGVFNLRVGDPTGEKGLAALATLDGQFTAATLIDRYADLSWLKPWLSGGARWKLAVRIPRAVGRITPPSQLSLASDLAGVAIDMPAPLRKSASTTLPLELKMALPVNEGDISLALGGDLMRLRARTRPAGPMAGAIQFGPGPLAASPASGLAIRGRVPLLDSTAWAGFSGAGDSGDVVHDVDVVADRLLFLDRGFADARLTLSRGSVLTQIVLKGKGIEGTVEIPRELARGVQGRFARLHLPADDAMPSAAVSAAASSEISDPSGLPALNFQIADLRLGQAQLGKAELATVPIAAGMRVTKFQTQARNLSVNAAGEWVRAGVGTRSNFRVDFKAGSLGQMLDALGFRDMVQAGPTKATLAGSWPGSPGAFSLATLTGSLKAEVGEGRLLDVEPGGSGRILGLISLAEIPRRLSLDFSDFFAKGFAFNVASGDFVFSDGRARTDNLRIDGPAAEIRVSGTTGLRDEVYDQRVEVLPKAGGILPAIGLIAGGPAGAAVGAVAQAVLQRPLKQTTRVVYRITGPWRTPVVKVIEKGPERTAQGGAAPAGR